MNQRAKADKQHHGAEWETLAYDCAALGYDSPERVMRTLFRGCYDASNQDIDIARCISSDMTDRQIADALGFSGENAAQSAVERLRKRLRVRSRVGVAGIAFRYRLQPWDGNRTTDEPMDYQRGLDEFRSVNITIEKCTPRYQVLEETYEPDEEGREPTLEHWEESRKDLAYHEISFYGHLHLGFVGDSDDATSHEQLREHLERFEQATERVIRLDQVQKRAAHQEHDQKSS